MGTIYRGWVKVKNGDVAEGMSLLRSGSAAYRATGTEVWTPYFFALLARACEIAGQIEEALTLLDDALRIVERTGERWLAAELNRHKGQLLLRQGHSEAAEELYRKALSIAEEQEAKLWELRAAVSLARLRRDQGRRAEARDLLAPVYGWFTEGFDTPDLPACRSGCRSGVVPSMVAWARPLPGSWDVVPGLTGTVPAAGLAYVFVGHGVAALGIGLTVYGYSARTGAPLWSQALTGFPAAAAIVSVRTWPGEVTAGVSYSRAGRLQRTEVVIAAASGALMGRYPAAPFGGAVGGSAQYTVVVGTTAVTSYDNATGRIRWQRATGPVEQTWRTDGSSLYVAEIGRRIPRLRAGHRAAPGSICISAARSSVLGIVLLLFQEITSQPTARPAAGRPPSVPPVPACRGLLAALGLARRHAKALGLAGRAVRYVAPSTG